MLAEVNAPEHESIVDELVRAYIDLYERHLVAPRPGPGKRLFHHWLPKLASARLDSFRMLSFLAKFASTIPTPRIALGLRMPSSSALPGTNTSPTPQTTTS